MDNLICGFSDDIVEVGCGINEEFNETKGTIDCSDGSVLSFEYKGNWEFKMIKKGVFLKYIKKSLGDTDNQRHPEHPKAASYSDVAIFSNELDWVKVNGVLKEKK